MHTLRDIKRASHVMNVLFRQGLGFAVEKTGFINKIPLYKRLHRSRFVPPKELAVKIREAMEELGGVYVKLGQFLSLRPDLVPPEFCYEFRNLQDSVAPLPFATVKHVIEQEMRQPLSKVFKKVEKVPVGSASIAQVHVAWLKTGEKVVIKVQRPGIRDIIEADIDIMYYLARKLKNHVAPAGYSPKIIIDEFGKYTKRELNFLIEARHIDTMRRNFKASRTVVIPKLYDRYTTMKVVVMEYIEGTKLYDLASSKKRYDRKLIVNRIVDAITKQIFDTNLFHADLHPGNILLLQGNKVAFLDFGIVGSLDEEMRGLGMKLYIALLRKDAETITDLLIRVGKVPGDLDKRSLRRAVHDVLVQSEGLNRVTGTHVLHLLFNEATKHNIQMPQDMLLLAKALVTVEGSCMLLNPEFNFMEYAEHKITQIMRKEVAQTFSRANLWKSSHKIKNYVSDVSTGTLEIIEKLKRGTVRINVEHTDVQALGVELDKSSNRLSYALVIAALLVTSALVVDMGPLYYNFSLFSIIGIVIAFVLMSVLFISILREPKRGEKYGIARD